MTLSVTLMLMAGCAFLVVISAWRAGKPAEPPRVRMVPWTLIMVVAAGVFILLLAHVFSLFGLETGQGFMRL